MAKQEAEPSVEDILASIKKVMADDSRKFQSERQTEESSQGQADAIEKLSDAVDEEAVDSLDEGAAVDITEDADNVSEPLIDSDASQSMRESLAALSTLSEPGSKPQIVRSGETSLEAMTRDLLRPMLKQWLDDNLPDMVEKLVAKEIKRITRKGG